MGEATGGDPTYGMLPNKLGSNVPLISCLKMYSPNAPLTWAVACCAGSEGAVAFASGGVFALALAGSVELAPVACAAGGGSGGGGCLDER